MERDYVLVKEAAAELGVSPWAIWKAIQLGQIKLDKERDRIGPMYAIPRQAWEEYKATKRDRGRPPKPA